MALELNSNTTATFQESIRPVQKASVQSTSIQDQDSNNVAAIGTAEMTSAGKMSNEQQDNTKEGSQQKGDSQASAQRFKSAITQANNKLKQTRTRCEFSYHEDTNRISIKVVDKETQEVIREIPPEESLEMLEKMWEIAGLLIDERR